MRTDSLDRERPKLKHSKHWKKNPMTLDCQGGNGLSHGGF